MSRVRGWRLGLGGFGIGELKGLSLLSPFCNGDCKRCLLECSESLVMGKFAVDPSDHGRQDQGSRVMLGFQGRCRSGRLSYVSFCGVLCLLREFERDVGHNGGHTNIITTHFNC